MSVVDDLNAAFQPWADSLSADEIEALRTYQGKNHAVINRVLRGLGLDKEVRMTEDQSRIIRETTRLLDAAIEKGRDHLPRDLMVHRGFQSYEALFGLHDKHHLTGLIVHDPAFLSTSVAQHRAERFCDFFQGFMLAFELPMTQPVAWLPLIGADDMQGQQELLLPRNLEIEVLATAEREGILYVEGFLL